LSRLRDLNFIWILSQELASMAASASFDPSLLEDPEIEELFENDILPFEQLDDVSNGGTSPKQGSSHKRKRSQSQNSENLIDLSEYTDTTKQNASEGNGDIYGVSRFGNWGEYMRRKRAKLQIQNASLDSNERRSNIFKDISVYVRVAGILLCVGAESVQVNGWTRPSVQDLRKLLIQHGGIFQPYLDKKSLMCAPIPYFCVILYVTLTRRTHIVTCSLTAAKLKEFKHMKVVRPEWLVDSVAAGVLLPWTDYIFRPGDRVDQSQGSQIGQRRLFKADQPAASGSTSASRADPSSSEANDEQVASGSNSGVKSGDGDPVPSNSQSSPRPLYMTDPATHEEAARIPGYAALGPNELAERVMADPQWRAAHTSIAPDFIEGYYKNSRLHHLSMWKAELKNLVIEAQERAEEGNPDTIHGSGGGDSDTTIPSVQANPADESSMRGTALIMTSPSKAKGKQKAEDVDRVIMHCDFDCFFVSAGLVSRPHLRGKPVVVCHSQGSQGGASSTSEIASSSYEARAFGIKNGMRRVLFSGAHARESSNDSS
jgi:DNA repair protein REV1